MERAKTKNIKFFWKMVESSIGRRKARMLTALLAIAMGATCLLYTSDAADDIALV